MGIEIASNGGSKGLFLCSGTHREKTRSNEISVLRDSMNMAIWVAGTANQLFIRGSLTETKFSEKQ